MMLYGLRKIGHLLKLNNMKGLIKTDETTGEKIIAPEGSTIVFTDGTEVQVNDYRDGSFREWNWGEIDEQINIGD